MKRKNILPPTYLAVFIIAIIGVHFLIPIKKLIFFPWNLIGTLPLLIGIALNLVADRAFKKIDTTVKPYENSTGLVTDGVFRISRHPMYLGMVLILLGLSILLGSLTPFFVIAFFVVIMDVVFIKVEEQMLQESFRLIYLEYKQKVRKWL